MGGVLREAYGAVFDRAGRRFLAESAGLWWAGVALLGMALAWAGAGGPAAPGPGDGGPATFALALLTTLAGAAVAVAWHRRLLLAEAAGPGAGGWAAPAGRRAVAYTLVSLLLGLVAFTPPVLLAFGMAAFGGGAFGGATGDAGPPPAVRLLITLLLLGGVYAFSRLSLALPALAVGVRANLRAAWALTRGNGWRVLLVTALAVAPVELGAAAVARLVAALPGAGPGVVWGVEQAALFVATSLGAAALSVTYRRLRGGAGPPPAIA